MVDKGMTAITYDENMTALTTEVIKNMHKEVEIVIRKFELEKRKTAKLDDQLRTARLDLARIQGARKRSRQMGQKNKFGETHPDSWVPATSSSPPTPTKFAPGEKTSTNDPGVRPMSAYTDVQSTRASTRAGMSPSSRPVTAGRSSRPVTAGRSSRPATAASDGMRSTHPPPTRLKQTMVAVTAFSSRPRGDDNAPGIRQEDLKKMKKTVLKTRLASSIHKLDVMRNENDDLRRKIDHKRSTKLQLLSVTHKLRELIRAKHRDLQAIKGVVSESNDILGDINERKKLLKKTVTVERKSFKENVVQLHDELRNSELQKKVYDVKLSRIEELELAAHRFEYVTTEEERQFSETGLMRKITKVAFLNCIQRRNMRRHQKNIEVFEQAFLTIKSSTGISDVEEIVKIFFKLEERNFSLLTFANQIHREIQWYQGYQKDNVAVQKSQDRQGDAHIARKNNALSKYTEELTRCNRFVENFSNRYSRHKAIFDSIFPKISIMRDNINSIALFTDSISNDMYKPPEALTEEFVIHWLVWLERIFLLWRDFLPRPKGPNAVTPVKAFPYTAGSAIKECLVPKKVIHATSTIPEISLLRVNELPSPDDHKDEEEEDRVLSLEEIKLRVQTQIARQAKRAMKQPKVESDAPSASSPVAHTWTYDEMVAPPLSEGSSEVSEEALTDERSEDGGAEPTNDELNTIFLKRYKMSRAELKCMGEKLGLELSHLCYLKQEFDNYDIDKSGYIDTSEFSLLLEKLGEELSERELEHAFRELDEDNSGEIEFFEFVEWFAVGDKDKDKDKDKRTGRGNKF